MVPEQMKRKPKKPRKRPNRHSQAIEREKLLVAYRCRCQSLEAKLRTAEELAEYKDGELEAAREELKQQDLNYQSLRGQHEILVEAYSTLKRQKRKLWPWSRT